MAALVIDNSAQVKLFWSAGSRSWMNVIGARGNPVLPVIDATLAQALFTAFGTAITSSGLGALLHTSVGLTQVSIRDISGPNRAEFVGTGTAVNGTGAGDLLPLSNAAVVTIRTAAAGKSYRGRVYFSGFTEAQNDTTGRALAAVNTAIFTFMGSVHATLSGHSMITAVLSAPREAHTIPEKVILGKSGFSTPAASFVTRNTKWESQRRRTGRI